MCETEIKTLDNFEKREAHWEIFRGPETRVVTQLGDKPAEFCGTLEEAAEQMAVMVKRTILAMPMNDARIITFDFWWS